MKHLTGIFFTFILSIVPAIYAQQRQLTMEDSNTERRVALVIGNAAYEIAPLKNPVNDAQDMAKALRELGFEVIYRENLNQNDMKRAIRAFGEKLRGGGIGLFYYAGHGVQVKGVNYLVPVNAKVETEEEVEYECVDAGFVLAQMESARNNMNIVILDACRNNPFARSFRSTSRGLASMDAPSGTLIAYATALGFVASDGNARNGLYTQELLKFMHTSGLDIEDVFKRVRVSVRNLTQAKQTPWEASSLIGDFYFVRRKEPDIKTSSQVASGTSNIKESDIKPSSPVVSSASNVAEQFYQQGKRLFEQQKWAEAEIPLRQAVQLDSNNTSYIGRLALVLSFQKKYAEAESEFRKGLRFDPNNFEWYSNLGLVLSFQDKDAEAEPVLRQGIKLKPDNANIRHILGDTLRSQKKYSEAETEYRMAVKLEPNNASYHNKLGATLFEQGKYAEAEAEFRRAVQLDPTNESYKNNVTRAENSQHPNTIRGENGQLRPANGYQWVNPNDPNDFRVERIP
ncbi:MAG TPA: caspase family protein [Nitrososphaera sp.]|jgi:Flp pilus assembly protein TadD|nr:caspase family protein [Nitrososphaera sp.]